MKVKNNIRPLLICIMGILLLFCLTAKAQERVLVQGSGFNLMFPIESSIAFQHSFTKTVSFRVESGTLNGSDGSLTMWTDSGILSFQSNEDATLTLTSLTDAPDSYKVTVNGNIVLLNQTFPLTLNQRNSITWEYYIESYVDKYTTLAIGLGGIGLMIFSPSWVAWKIRKSGADVSTIERFGYGMLLFFIGFGLFIIWLWS